MIAGASRPAPAGRAPAADAAEWFVRLAFDGSPGMARLRAYAAGLREARGGDGLFALILDDAMRITGADLGNVQLVDPGTGALRIVAESGFCAEFLEHFTAVEDTGAACGRAAATGTQTLIADVATDPGFAPHRTAAAAAGFRSVQSTPLTDHTGRLVGMVSTHFRGPAPAPPGLELMADYGRLGGEAVARWLRGRGVDLGSAGSAPGPRPEPGPGPDGAVLSEIAGLVIERVLSAGLDLAEVRSLLGDAPIRRRADAAAAELDRVIREIRLAVQTGSAAPARE
jgi:hypothetical protein